MKSNKSLHVLCNHCIVYCYLVADLPHIGHILHLQKAREQGDYVIAGILTNEATQERKPEPIMDYEERAFIMRAIRYIDEVVPQTTYSPIPNILRIKPDIVMESTSHKKEDIEEITRIVENYGGKVVVNPYYEKQSTTNIKNMIRFGVR